MVFFEYLQDSTQFDCYISELLQRFLTLIRGEYLLLEPLRTIAMSSIFYVQSTLYGELYRVTRNTIDSVPR
jgi:hypothetical protein